MRVLVACLLIASLLAGCSGSDTPTQDPVTVTATTTRSTTVTATVTAAPTTSQTATSTPITSTSTTATQTQTTAPGIQPVVENVTRTTLTDTSVVVQWNVTGGDDVRSKLEYGQSGFSLAASAVNGTGPRQVTVTGLRSCTDYTSRVVALGGGFTTTSDTLNFKTLGSAPTLSTPVTSAILQDKFTVSWTVAGPADSVSWVEYGGTTAYGSRTTNSVGSGARTAVLTGLLADADVNFRVRVESGCGTADSGNRIQRTAQVMDVEVTSTLGILTLNPNTVNLDDARWYVFRIKNSHAAAHVWSIVDQGYTSASIAPATTYTMPQSIQLAPGAYDMKASTAEGNVNVS